MGIFFPYNFYNQLAFKRNVLLKIFSNDCDYCRDVMHYVYKGLCNQ